MIMFAFHFRQHSRAFVGVTPQYKVTRLVQDIHTARNAHNHVGLVFIDLAKAFDTVWHRVS